MKVTLITASFNDEVHGTFNDKKTGCGINLQKPDNASRYRRGGQMTDLGEITCEKCKTKIATEMIKSDKKEMKAILKEERMRAKKGLEDEGIVPLGNTTAKITAPQNVPEPEPEPAPAPEPPKPAFQANGAPVLDNDLAQFAIKKPEEVPEPEHPFVLEQPKLFDDEPVKPIAEETPAPADGEDDFLAQFAIQKPVETEDIQEEPEEEDFLAQFAIEAPPKEAPAPAPAPEPETPPVIDDISAALAAMEQNPIAAAAPEIPEPLPEPEDEPVPTEEDIMKMFSIGHPKDSEVEVLSDNVPETVGRYDNDSSVIDVAEHHITEVNTEPVQPAEQEVPMNEQISEWDLIANQLFGESSEEDIQPETTVEEVKAPVIEDISPVTAEKVKAPVIEDIAPVAVEEVKAPIIEDIAPVAVEEVKAPIIEDIAPVAVEEVKAPVLEDIAPVAAEEVKVPVLEDIAPVAVEEVKAPVLEDIAPVAAEEIKVPVIEDIAPIAAEEVKIPVIEDIDPFAAEEVKIPVIEDIAPVAAEEIKVPVIEDIAPIAAEEVKAPVIEDIAPVAVEEVKAPVIEDIAPATIEEDRPVLEDIVDDDDELELISENLEPKAPVLNDISAALSALNAPEPVPQKQPVAPAPVQASPVISDISAALSALNAPAQPVGAVPNQNVIPTPVPVQPVPVQVPPVAPAPIPVQPISPVPIPPVAPAPVPVQPIAPASMAAPAGTVGQIISVPQLTGYNEQNQPIYTYVQMQIQGYDQMGQPVLVPLPGQNIPVPSAPAPAFNKNTRLQDALAAAKEIPTSTKEMTPGQRIAAAEAAKGSPVSANVSKIATNPHARSTSQAFISAISESKEYANQSLTETQGLKQRTTVLSSVEDVLSQLGDNSLKEKKMAEAKAQNNIPAYQEFRTPARTSSASRPSAAQTASNPAPAENRPLTKAELKAKKKQEKIDAKFQKEMAKRK